MRLFFDNNLSPALAGVFRALGYDAIHIDDGYSVLHRHMPDEEWLEFLDQPDERRLVLTVDKGMKRSGSVRAAFQRTKLTVFCLDAKLTKSSPEELAALPLYNLPKFKLWVFAKHPSVIMVSRQRGGARLRFDPPEPHRRAR